ncbi:MAG: hypothetical protein ABI999_08755 [Acidobacteriota bacterium]
MKITFSIFIMFASFLNAPTQTNKTQKADEFGNISCDEYIARMDNFFLALNKEPEAKGYVMVYEGDVERAIHDRQGNPIGSHFVLPGRNQAKASIFTMKERLAFSKYPSDRIVFVEAGFRKRYVVDSGLYLEERHRPNPR